MSRLPELVRKVAATLEQYDRDLDLRTRSLELTSEELVGANERLREDIARRNRVLEALRSAAATLLGADRGGVGFPGPSDIEGLSALLPVLVRQQEENRIALAESERRLSDLYQNTPVMLHATDDSDVLISVNNYWLSRLGYERSEVIGRSLMEFMTEESRDRAVREVLPAYRRVGFCADASFQMLKKDGRRLDVLFSAYSDKGRTREDLRTLAAMVDVTEQRRAQRLQAALLEVSEAAHSTAGLVEMFRRLHEIIGQLLPARNFFVALYDASDKTLTFPYFVDEYDPPPRPRKLGEGTLTEEVLLSGEALLVTPPMMAARVKGGGSVIGTDSIDWLGVPLKTASGTIGVLAVQSYAGSVRYAESDKVLLEFVSAQAAASIERKRADSNLKESERRLQMALDAAHLALWDYDLERGEVYLSEAWSEFLGAPPQPTVTRFEDLAALLPADDRERVRAAMVPAVKGFQDKYKVEHRVTRPDGRHVWVLSQGRIIERDASGRALRVVGTNRDITEDKRAEEARELAALVYQHSSEGMMVTDANNRIIAVNPAFTALTGYSAEEAIGETPRLLRSARHTADFYRGMWESLNATGRFQGEIWNRHRDGHIFPETLSINTIRHEDGSVHRRVALFSDITKIKEAEGRIWQQANFDELTQLPNRRMFRDRLDQDLKKARRDRTLVALLFVDLDRFKEVNDTLGHDNGDILLIEAARRIRECVRETDIVARFGGDEFTIALPGLEGPGPVRFIAQKVIDALAKSPFALESERVFVTASVGVTLYPDDGSEIEDLFKHADQALYAAKAAGRNRVSYFTPELQVGAVARMRLASDLWGALAAGEFTLHFQPVVDLLTGRIRKAEALIRWRHPQQGLIGPAQFIPIAEACGSIVEIGEWVFREAMTWLKRWRDAGQRDFQLSINQSPREFQSDGNNYLEWMRRLEAAGLPGQCLVVEITEGLLLDASPEVKAKLLALSQAGIEVALDDFGVGYSSLSYLKNLHIDYLKIDRSFTRNLAPGSSDMALSEAIIVMAHKLGLEVIAEGVETEAQLELLRGAGCDYGQGYLFAEPMPGEVFEKLLLGNSARPLPD